MIKLDTIEELIKLTLFTGYLKDERPLSLLIIAKVQSGKTETVAQFAENDGVAFINNFTPTAFLDRYANDFLESKFKHLIIPDLITPISRQKYLVDSTITFLNGFMEEGVKEILSYALDNRGIKLPKPIRGGVITTIAKEDFERRARRWTAVGFLSRFLAVSYDYNQDTVKEILHAILDGKAVGKPIKLSLPAASHKIELPKEVGEELIKPVTAQQKQLEPYGFRLLRHLVRLVKANALSEGRSAVNKSDTMKVLDLAQFCNLDYKRI